MRTLFISLCLAAVLCFTTSMYAPPSFWCPYKPDREKCSKHSKPITQWYFDGKSLSCKRFDYRGCGGRGNHFATKEDCERDCREYMRPNK